MLKSVFIRKNSEAWGWILMLIILLLTVVSCSGSTRYFLRKGFDPHGVKRIAVMPIENLTSTEFAAEKIRSLVIMDLLERGLDVVEPGEIYSILRGRRIRSVYQVPSSVVVEAGREVAADAVVIGSVATFGIQKGISVTYPEVTINLIMMDTATGNVVWSTWHTSGGADFWTRHFGAEVDTVDETARKVVKESLDTLF
jgi:TolB-like protein